MKKKLLSLLLAIAMVVSLVPAAAAAGYADVDPDKWYAEAVDYVTAHNLMQGVGGNCFAPYGSMTRAMTVQVLYRMAGSPGVEGRENPFRDVAADAWYADAVVWAVENGITQGTTSTTFRPSRQVTREQLVTFLYNYANYMGLATEQAPLEGYSDAERVASWAVDAMGWAIHDGIVSGSRDHRLAPKSLASRAECAVILMRFDRLVQQTKPCQHDWDEGTVTKQPTCTEDGEKVYTCRLCGALRQEILHSKGHDYRPDYDRNREATCTEEGCYVYVCRFCGDIVTQTFPALGHNWDEGYVTKQPTWNEDGVRTYTCHRCGEIREEIIPALTDCDHDWDGGEVTKEPTCTESGTRTYTCQLCGKTRTEVIPALGHDWDEGTVTKYPTWKEEGVRLYTCRRCGETREESIPVLTDCDHYWDVGEITRKPTCTEPGTRTYTCQRCGKTRQEAIPAYGHDWDGGYVVKQPTWNEDGVRIYTCYSCGETREERIPALTDCRHDWDGGAVRTLPTCTEEGERVFVCLICGKHRSEPIPALGHDWNDGAMIKYPTWNEEGIKRFTCRRCGETREERIPIITDCQHDWDEGTVTKQPTCTEAGEKVYTCHHCGKPRTEVVPALDHSWEVQMEVTHEVRAHCRECKTDFGPGEEGVAAAIAHVTASDDDNCRVYYTRPDVHYQPVSRTCTRCGREEAVQACQEHQWEDVVERVEEPNTICNGCHRNFGSGRDAIDAVAVHILDSDTCNNYTTIIVRVDRVVAKRCKTCGRELRFDTPCDCTFEDILEDRDQIHTFCDGCGQDFGAEDEWAQRNAEIHMKNNPWGHCTSCHTQTVRVRVKLGERCTKCGREDYNLVHDRHARSEDTYWLQEEHYFCDGCGQDFGPGAEGEAQAAEHADWSRYDGCTGYHKAMQDVRCTYGFTCTGCWREEVMLPHGGCHYADIKRWRAEEHIVCNGCGADFGIGESGIRAAEAHFREDAADDCSGYHVEKLYMIHLAGRRCTECGKEYQWLF